MKNYIFLINTMQINYRKLLYTHTKRRPNDGPFDDLKSSLFCTIFKGPFGWRGKKWEDRKW